jgi:hypothetical protein
MLTPDARSGTGIVLEAGMDIYGRKYQPLPAIGYEPHGYSLILDALFEAPHANPDAEGRIRRTPLVQRVGGPAWPSGLKPAGDGLLRNVLFDRDWTWPDTTFEIGNIIHLAEDNTFRIRRADDAVRIDGTDILLPQPVDPLQPRFWDTALPRPALVHLMPETAIWFDHHRDRRADERRRVSEENKGQ